MSTEEIVNFLRNIQLTSPGEQTAPTPSTIWESDGATISSDSMSLPLETSMLELLQQHQQNQYADFGALPQQNALEQPPRPFYRNIVHPRIHEQIKNLPIYQRDQEWMEVIKKNQVVIFSGETGSGKSTQVPQCIAAADMHNNKTIGVTQPRRVAAKALATRVSQECGVEVGTVVGYAVRFDTKVSANTVIKYMTDGRLVTECVSGTGLLDDYSVIIIDEAHERRIDTDMCFGHLKRILSKRPDLKVIICSATLETEKFSKYFNNAPVFNVSGQGYDVEILYEPQHGHHYIKGAVETVIKINTSHPRGESKGDILVFLSGQDEIEMMLDMLKVAEKALKSLYDDLVITPCYGSLPLEEQQKIFDKTPDFCRKVVLATNVAETSLTIDGIVYVIDCGFFKQKEYNHNSGIYSLVKQRITKAIQRAGRAGRTQPGKCYRLYKELEFVSKMKETQAPEITRSNLDSVVLIIVAMKIGDPLKFDFLDPPTQEAIENAIEHLLELGAIEVDGTGLKLTYLGQRMVEFPLSPSLAKVVIESEKLGCSSEVLKIVALLNFQSIFYRNKHNKKEADLAIAEFQHSDGDLLTLLNVYNAWREEKRSETWCRDNFIHYSYMMEAEEIRKQLRDILKSRHVSGIYKRGRFKPSRYVVDDNIRRAFTAGYFRQLAEYNLKRNSYQLVGKSVHIGDVFLHPSSSLVRAYRPPPYVIYQEIFSTNKTYMNGTIAVEPDWIVQYAPEFARKIGPLA